jgi:hypothetical protein
VGETVTQKFLIVCPDRREFLDPVNFGDSPELVFFANRECGVMSALAVLLARTNGMGDGDIWTEASSPPLNCLRQPFDHTRQFTAKGPAKDARVPLGTGRWFGKAICFVGDLDSATNHLDRKWMYEQAGYPESYKPVPVWFDLVPQAYRNISDMMIEGIAACGAMQCHPLSRLDLNVAPEERSLPSCEEAQEMPRLTPNEPPRPGPLKGEFPDFSRVKVEL